MTRISILGAGFAALSAVAAIRRAAPAAEITVVAPRPIFVYLPSLIWVPSKLRQGPELEVPLDAFFRRHRVTFHQAEVTGLAEGGRLVHTSQGDVTNDGLLIASGARFIRKLPGIEHALVPCQGIKDAQAIAERLATLSGGTIAIGFGGNPNEPTAVRGGPMFEFLFGIDTLLRRQGRRHLFKLVFFNPAAEPGKRLGDKAVAGLLAEMKRRDIETHLGHKIKAFTPNSVQTEGGEFAADLILFLPGLTGPAWLENSELPRSPGGMIQADAHCRVPGFERTYVAGDSGSFPGPDWLPKQAHMADVLARTASANLVAEMSGHPADATFRPELICIIDDGRSGILVARFPRFNLVLPRMVPMHWAKRAFERSYLRRFR